MAKKPTVMDEQPLGPHESALWAIKILEECLKQMDTGEAKIGTLHEFHGRRLANIKSDVLGHQARQGDK